MVLKKSKAFKKNTYLNIKGYYKKISLLIAKRLITFDTLIV